MAINPSITNHFQKELSEKIKRDMEAMAEYQGLNQMFRDNGTIRIRAPQPTPLDMIWMRLRLRPMPGVKSFNHIEAYLSDTKACVFVVTLKDEAVLLDDDPALFPSDNLITQLRLLVG